MVTARVSAMPDARLDEWRAAAAATAHPCPSRSRATATTPSTLVVDDVAVGGAVITYDERGRPRRAPRCSGSQTTLPHDAARVLGGRRSPALEAHVRARGARVLGHRGAARPRRRVRRRRLPGHDDHGLQAAGPRAPSTSCRRTSGSRCGDMDVDERRRYADGRLGVRPRRDGAGRRVAGTERVPGRPRRAHGRPGRRPAARGRAAAGGPPRRRTIGRALGHRRDLRRRCHRLPRQPHRPVPRVPRPAG